MESGMQMEEMIQKTVTTLATMLDYLGLKAEVTAEEKNGRIYVKTKSEDAGRIIGKKGQTLDNLQFLLNRMMLRFDTKFPRITIDVDGYSDGKSEKRRENRNRRRTEGPGTKRQKKEPQEDPNRDENLKQQALDAAKEVKRWGEAVTLPPMNSHERRVVHTTLQQDPEITTESLETDNPRLKRVVVKLSKKES
ncbi:MAG TPA: KH domain-containing protein [Victivallales bacterium]|nr:KH domain-containing protein [Victivallales bacterium]HRR05706.1 KH domain-containing protein [Victivallales bacterium]